MLANQDGKPKRYPLNDWYRTPNMERLAKQGVPVLSILRSVGLFANGASIMTGTKLSARHR